MNDFWQVEDQIPEGCSIEKDLSSVETEGPQQGPYCLCGSELPITGG